MKLTVGAGELSLPDDFSFEIESNHPFFSDEGTASVPVTIPASGKNLEILGGSDNIHRGNRHVRKIPAYLQAGVFRRQCRLISESAGRSSGVSASLAFLESDMYSELKERNLRDIFAAIQLTFNETVIMSLYKGEYRNSHPELTIFPVASDMDSDDNVTIINHPDFLKLGMLDGIGWSPYLYLWYVIEETFIQSGYTIGADPFKTDVELKELVLVNNCSNPLVRTTYWAYTLFYSDLVPDITVTDLLTFLHDVFGAYVTTDSSRTVNIRLIRDDLATTPDMDLTEYARTDESVFYPEPVSIDRSFDTSIDKAEPAAETLPDLRALYDSCTSILMSSLITGYGLYHTYATGQYFYKSSGTGSEPVRLGSDCFRYHRSLGMDAEEISASNRYLPMVYVEDGEISLFMPYIGEIIYRDPGQTDGKDSSDSQAIQLCYAFLFTEQAASGEDEPGQHFCGSTYSLTEDGRLTKGKIYNSLTPEGLTPYWRDYETLKVNGAPEIDVTLDMPVSEFLAMDRFAPKIYKGTKVIIRSMNYTVRDSGVFTIKMKFQLLPVYNDSVYIPEKIQFKSMSWTLVSTKPSGSFSAVASDGLEDYTSSDAPGFTPNIIGQIVKKRNRWARVSYPGVQGTYTISWEEYFIAEEAE